MSFERVSWMKNISGDVNIKSINIPGTHDSATKFCQFSLFSRCQKKCVMSQLRIGVRAIDLRVNGEEIVHSFAKCKTSSGNVLKTTHIVNDILSFLEENPSETVILFFKNDGKVAGKECLDLFVNNIINKDLTKWYLKNSFPVLSQVRGKIIFVNRIDSSIGLDFSGMPYQPDKNGGDGDRFYVNEGESVYLQDYCLLSCKKKWEQSFVPMLSRKAEEEFVLNYLSTSGFPYVPELNAHKLNSQFKKLKLNKGFYYGIIMTDFTDKNITRKIINTNFK